MIAWAGACVFCRRAIQTDDDGYGWEDADGGLACPPSTTMHKSHEPEVPPVIDDVATDRTTDQPGWVQRQRSPIRSRTHHVTDAERAVYAAVEARDPMCMAPVLDEVEQNRWPGCCGGRLTMQHVKEGPGGRRITDEAHLLRLCEWHHLYTGWATSKHGLALQRAYLAGLYPDAWA